MRRVGIDHAILHRNGIVTEGAAHNVRMTRAGEIWTHPGDQWILAGITRGISLELCRQLRILVHEEPFSNQTLRASDEVMITSTTTNVASVVHLDGQLVGDGSPGPIASRLQAGLLRHIERVCGHSG